MKSIIYIPIILVFSSFLIIKKQNQDRNILHVLYSKRIVRLENPIVDKKIPADISKLMNEAYEIGLTFQSELLCTKDKSLFKMIDKLESNNTIANNFANILFGGDFNYKNQITKEKIRQVILKDEYLNIEVPFDYYKWNITNETKDISGYKCYKATADWIDYNKTRNIQTLRKAIAWFAPSIHYSFGPNGLDGLPGLVLEGSKDGVNYFYASKITFDYKSKYEIEKPKKGRYLTIDEYNDLILKDYNDTRPK